MSIACKVCDSDKKDSIEQMILQGYSNLYIANSLKDMGIDISHASINRHKNTHMKEHEEKIKELASSKCNTKYDRNDNLGEINASEILEEMKLKNSLMQTYSDMAENFSLLSYMTMEIVNNQMAITIDLQKKYMKGECKYPYEQIKGMELVQNMLQKLENFSNTTFKHKKDIIEKGNSENYVFQKGSLAKIQMRKYCKGDMFKLMYKAKNLRKGYEEYRKIYIPENPYRDDMFNKSFNDFDKGVDSATNQYEHADYDIYNSIKPYEDNDILNNPKLYIDFINSILKTLIKKYDYDEIWNIISEYDELIENKAYEDENELD
jgi:hypothetical protein